MNTTNSNQNICEIDYEFKDERLDWNKFKEIKCYNDWTKRWKLEKEADCTGGQSTIFWTTAICTETEIEREKEKEIKSGFITKVYKYKNEKQLTKILQEYLMVQTLDLLIYYEIAFGKNDTEIYITMSILNVCYIVFVFLHFLSLHSMHIIMINSIHCNQQ